MLEAVLVVNRQLRQEEQRRAATSCGGGSANTKISHEECKCKPTLGPRYLTTKEVDAA